MLQPIIVIPFIDRLCSWIFTPNFATMAPKRNAPARAARPPLAVSQASSAHEFA